MFYPRCLGFLVMFPLSLSFCSGFISWGSPQFKPDIGCLCATITIIYFSLRADCKSKLLWLVWYSLSPSQILQNIHTKVTRIEGWSLHVGTSSTSLYLVSWLGSVFINETLLWVFGESPIGLFVGFHGTTLANNLIRYNSFLVLETLFGGKKWPFGTPTPWLFGDYIKITFIYFQKFLLH